MRRNICIYKKVYDSDFLFSPKEDQFGFICSYACFSMYIYYMYIYEVGFFNTFLKNKKLLLKHTLVVVVVVVVVVIVACG